MNQPRQTGEWTSDAHSIEKLELYAEVAGPMRQSARQGLWSGLRHPPFDHDVEEVLMVAFEQLWAKDRTEVRSPVALGARIAFQRGRDRARRNRREQRRTQPTETLDLREDPIEEPVDEVLHEMLVAILVECMQELTEPQRAVIDATLVGRLGEDPMSLADWVRLEHDPPKTYEAWRRQRERGVESLRRCGHRREAELGLNDE